MTEPASSPSPLNPLGLAPGEEAMYELLIQQPFATKPELAAAWAGREDTCGQDVSAVLAGLERRGLVEVLAGPPIGYSPASPGIAFRSLLLDHERRLAAARQYRASLDEAYRVRADGPRTPRLVEVVTGERAVRQRLDEMLNRAAQEVSCLSGAPSKGNLAAYATLADQGGLTRRTIYGQEFLSQPGALPAVAELIQCGLQARVWPELTLQLYIVDSAVALLCEHGAAAVEIATIVHPSALLDALVKLFEAMWQSAVPIRPPGERAASSRRTPAYDQALLITLLRSGLTDAAIGRRLGRSQRSIQRHVAALMADLGAHTRFQAGAQAARRLGPMPRTGVVLDDQAQPHGRSRCPGRRGDAGCARLLGENAGRKALLLERLGPPMHDIVTDPARRHSLLCDAAARLWRPAGPGTGLPTGADLAEQYAGRLSCIRGCITKLSLPGMTAHSLRRPCSKPR